MYCIQRQQYYGLISLQPIVVLQLITLKTQTRLTIHSYPITGFLFNSTIRLMHGKIRR